MKPAVIRPPRPSPFVVGQRYRVRRDFKSLRDSFLAGEILTYDRDTWSRYDECTCYVFTQSQARSLRYWDIDDDEHLAIWTDLFEPVPSEEASSR